MREPIDVEQFLNDEIEFNKRKLDELFKSIEFRRGYAEGLERARETLDELCDFYAKVMKDKDNEILSLQCQLLAQDEEYQKEVNEWMNAPMGPCEDGEKFVITRGRSVDENGALIDTDDLDNDPECFVDVFVDQEDKGE